MHSFWFGFSAVAVGLGIGCIIAYLEHRKDKKVEEEALLGIGAADEATANIISGCPFANTVYQHDPLASKDHTEAQLFIDDDIYFEQESDIQLLLDGDDEDAPTKLNPDYSRADETGSIYFVGNTQVTREAFQYADWVSGCRDGRAAAEFDQIMDDVKEKLTNLSKQGNFYD